MLVAKETDRLRKRAKFVKPRLAWPGFLEESPMDLRDINTKRKVPSTTPVTAQGANKKAKSSEAEEEKKIADLQWLAARAPSVETACFVETPSAPSTSSWSDLELSLFL